MNNPLPFSSLEEDECNKLTKRLATKDWNEVDPKHSSTLKPEPIVLNQNSDKTEEKGKEEYSKNKMSNTDPPKGAEEQGREKGKKSTTRILRRMLTNQREQQSKGWKNGQAKRRQ